MDMDLLVRIGETESALGELKFLGYKSFVPEQGVNSSIFLKMKYYWLYPDQSGL